MLFQRREIPWEVVDNKTVDPVPIFFEDSELELAVVKQGFVRRNYVLEVKPNVALRPELQKAVIFAQGQLLDEIEQNGYNVLLSESWRVTLLRRGKFYRVEVEYSGRPARATNPGSRRQPPYIAVLHDMSHGAAHGAATPIAKEVDGGKVLHKRTSGYIAMRCLIKA